MTPPPCRARPCRSGGEVPSSQPRPRRPDATSAEEDSEPRLALDTGDMPAAASRVAPATVAELDVAMAPIVSRLLGGVIDLAIMSGIDVVVLYFTLKICELTFAEWSRLPLAPLLAFLLLLNGGYLATFIAAGGQTIGKMATGIRVIPGDPDAGATDRVPLGQAIVRAACYGISVLLAGLGFLPAASVRSTARCTIASPTRASSKRDSPRRLPRDRRVTAAISRSRQGRSARRRACSST